MSEFTEMPAGSAAMNKLGHALAEAGAASVNGRRDTLADGLLRASLAQWEDPDTRPQLLADLIAALTDDSGADRMRAFMSSQSSQLFKEFGAAIDPKGTMDLNHAAEVLQVSPLHINAAQAQVWGVVILRYILRLEPIASASTDELLELLVPTIQRYLGGVTPGGS